MNKRNACLVGLAAGATLLAGCVAQYQNPSACEQEMRARLANASLGQVSVTHTAVAYRGERVVVEGMLERGALPASGVLSTTAAAAAAGTSGTPAVSASGALAASAAVAAQGASAAAAEAAAEPRPTTPMAALAVKLGLHQAPRPPVAVECTYDKTGSLTSFRWLSPGALAKTTPAPDADE
jgi:hypothetical protein